MSNQYTKQNKIERARQLHQQGVGNTEIAQRLGSTPKSIGNMIHTTREMLMAEIGEPEKRRVLVPQTIPSEMPDGTPVEPPPIIEPVKVPEKEPV